MIEELKIIMEAFGEASQMAAWVAAAYFLVGLVKTLCVLFAIVTTIKIISKTSLDWINKPEIVHVEDFCIGSESARRLREILEQQKRDNSKWLFDSDVDRIAKKLSNKD